MPLNGKAQATSLMRLENDLPNEQTENGKGINENRKLVLAIAKDDEEALQAFELLRKRGCFNTRLWKWDTRDEMKLIRRYYIYPKEPMLAIQRSKLYGLMDLMSNDLPIILIGGTKGIAK